MDFSGGDAALRCISTLLRRLHPVSPLQQLTFTVRTSASASRASVDELYAALGAYSASFTSCSIAMGVSTPATEPPLTLRTLTPLLALPLRTFNFARGNFDIGLENLQAIADAWRRLARLCLGHASLLSAARIPVDALPDIARRLPHLAELGLVVHDDCGPLDVGLAEPPAMQRMRGLVLGGGSALRDPERVARYLARSFPSSRLRLRARGGELVPEPWYKAVKDEMARRRMSEVARTEPYERSSESEDEMKIWVRRGAEDA